MNSSKEKGNLVYIPSATYLSKMKEDGTAPKKIVCLKELVMQDLRKVMSTMSLLLEKHLIIDRLNVRS